MNPGKIRMYKDRALDYQKHPRTFGWLFDRRQVLNDELHRFESLTPGEKALDLAQHPNLEADKVEADAIRDLIYPQMDKAAGKPKGYFRDLQRRNGAVIEAERSTIKNLDRIEEGAHLRAGPISERTSGSTYMTGEGRPGFAFHRVHRLLSKPHPETFLDSRVASAFGNSIATKTGNLISSPISAELMALPLRELMLPDMPRGPKTRKLEEIRDQYTTPSQ